MGSSQASFKLFPICFLLKVTSELASVMISRMLCSSLCIICCLLINNPFLNCASCIWTKSFVTCYSYPLYIQYSRFHICINSRSISLRQFLFLLLILPWPDCFTLQACSIPFTIFNFLQQKEWESALRLELIRSLCAKIKDCTTSNFSFPPQNLCLSQLVAV